MASPNSRDTLIEYCKRKLGDPVIEINVDEDQLEDRVDEAIQLYQEYHSDATVKTYFKHLVTADDVTNEYIPISSNIIYIARLFPIHTSSASRNFFDVKYQLMLNDMWDLNSVVGGIAYYEQTQQYLSMLDMKLNGTPQVTFARRQNRLYVHGDFQDKDIKAGDLLAIPATGAYGRSMASNYNHMPRPSVIAVINGTAREILRRETEDDLLNLDVIQAPRQLS